MPRKLSQVRFRQPTEAPDFSSHQTFKSEDFDIALLDDGACIEVRHRASGKVGLYPFTSTAFVIVAPEPVVKK